MYDHHRKYRYSIIMLQDNAKLKMYHYDTFIVLYRGEIKIFFIYSNFWHGLCLSKA